MNKMTFKKNIGTLVFSTFVLLGVLTVSNVTLADTATCAGSVMTVDEARNFTNTGAVSAVVTVNGSTASAVFVNNTNCSMPVDLKSYKMYDQTTDNQVFFADVSGNVAANSTQTLTVNLPSCMAQVDAYYGTGPSDLKQSAPNASLMGYAFSQNNTKSYFDASGNFCTNVVTPPTLNVSCSANSSSVNVGNSITWTSNVSGGVGSYTYAWTGTDGLSGNSQTTSDYYSNAGTKYGYLTVTSGTQTANASCSVVVNNNYYSDTNLSVSCYASPSNVQTGQQMHWYVDVSGGNGNYEYDWNGSDGLNSSSRSPYMVYNYPGSKNATVRVYSNGDSATAYCYANVNQNTVLAFSQSNPTPLAGAVYLSQVPYTGLADDLNLVWFTLGLALFSAYIAYVVIQYKKNGAA